MLVTELVDSNEDYTLTVPLSEGTHYAVRLEGMKHESLHNGLFSTSISGDYRVTTIEVEFNGEPVKLIEPQTNVTNGGDGPNSPLDGNFKSGWTAGKPREVKDTPTWFARFEKPLEGGKDAKLVVRIRNESSDSYAPIGRFRVSLTEYPTPTFAKDLGFRQCRR